MCNHNIHANSGRVDLNYHPKWSILGSASLRNLRRKIKCYFFTCTLQLSSGFHFIFEIIVWCMYSQFTGKLSFEWILCLIWNDNVSNRMATLHEFSILQFVFVIPCGCNWIAMHYLWEPRSFTHGTLGWSNPWTIWHGQTLSMNSPCLPNMHMLHKVH